MKTLLAWLRNNWALAGGLMLAGVVLYRLWPRTKTTLTWTEIPIITGSPRDEPTYPADAGMPSAASLAAYEHS
jgi:hypothetical protein